MCVGVSVWLGASACNTDTTPTQPHRNSNTHRTKNYTPNVVIQQNSRKLLMTDILMCETCWAHKKWNKIANDIKLVFYSSTITMMHGPINMRFLFSLFLISPSLFLSLIGSLFIRWLSVDTSCRLVYHIDAAHSTDRPHACRSKAEEWQMTVVRLKMILYYEVLQICIFIIGAF